ncbi:uncharacterized protein LOC135111973 isoform X4 [Scylla paramamosain]|uniref:uncharacterized protein LOC135111973 isoform X4 n=1 Tax=Scylla paramamosain TaxID=85552 RepID=UPI003082D6BA
MSGVVWMCASVNLSYLRLSVRRLEQEIAEPCCRGKDGRWCRGEHCQHVQEERKDGRWCRDEHSQHMQEERKDGRWCRGEHCQHVQEERKDGRWCRGEHCQHVQEERKDGRWCRGEHFQHVQEESAYLLHYIMCTLFWNSMLNFFFSMSTETCLLPAFLLSASHESMKEKKDVLPWYRVSSIIH